MKNIKIIISKEALFDDIRSIAYTEGEIILSETGVERRELQDIVEDGNRGRVLRLLNMAYSECLEVLYPYTKKAVENDCSANSNIDDNIEEYVYSLSFDDDFSDTTHDILTRYIHEYMLGRALSEMISIVNPKQAAKWQEKCKETITNIKSRLNNRTRIVRRTPHPF